LVTRALLRNIASRSAREALVVAETTSREMRDNHDHEQSEEAEREVDFAR
jgi:hypothetical protein